MNKEIELFSQNKVAELLFGTFPRYIGPIQKQVRNFPELLSHMTAQSGAMNAFTSVYSFYSFFTPVIDKLFLENEYSPDNPEINLKIGQQLFETCNEYYGLPTIPLWSGNKSPHIFPLFLPEIINNPSDHIKRLAYKISLTANQYYIKKSLNENTQTYENKYVPFIDTRVLEPRRLCRFPNTRRISKSRVPSNNFCVILDPERFPDMSYSEVLDLSSSPQYKPIKLKRPSKKISAIPVDTINLDEWEGIVSSNIQKFDNEYTEAEQTIQPSHIEYMINRLIKRPCNRKALTLCNPSQKARTSVTAELLEKKIPKTFAKFLFSQLNWFDYDSSTTSYHVDQIYDKKLKPSGMRIMQQEGLCVPSQVSHSPCNKCMNNNRCV